MGVLTSSPRFAPVVPAFTIVYDSFDRANSTTTLGTADSGETWTAAAGTWGVTGNQAYSVTATDGNKAFIDTGSPDQSVTAKLTIPDAASYVGLIARATDSSNFYIVNFNLNDTFVYKVVGGSATQLDSNPANTASGDICEFSVVGASLVVRVNGVIRHNLTDSAITTGNLAGMSYGTNSGSPAIRWDDFAVTPMSGGTVTVPGDGYVYHTFTTSGTLAPISDPVEVEYLTVAGGGGGGSGSGGGGGAGGLLSGTATVASAQTVTIGGGGAGGIDNGAVPTNGTDTSLGAIAATGGGRGGYGAAPANGAVGGSGGGAGMEGAGGSGTSGQGNAGGTGAVRLGAGGGGASEVGGNGANPAGGDGSQWPAGSGTYYAGGGGGGSRSSPTTPGTGGLGGGGNGTHDPSLVAGDGLPGTANTGGGGGGGGQLSDGATGGSGIVKVRYPVDYAWTGIHDTFTRANSTTTLGNAESGEAWDALAGTWGITGNKAYSVNDDDNDKAVVTVGSNDMVVSARVDSDGAYPGLIARCSDASNYYLAQVGPASGTQIRKCVGGSFTQLGSATSHTIGTYDLEFSVIGDQLIFKVNGIVVSSLTDTAITTGTKAGIRHGVAGVANIRFDDFTARSA